jgi:hypothetical protein
MLLEIILHLDCDESDNHVLASLTQRRVPFDNHVEDRAVPTITPDRRGQQLIPLDLPSEVRRIRQIRTQFHEELHA